eukprot:g69071.t1
MSDKYLQPTVPPPLSYSATVTDEPRGKPPTNFHIKPGLCHEVHGEVEAHGTADILVDPYYEINISFRRRPGTGLTGACLKPLLIILLNILPTSVYHHR